LIARLLHAVTAVSGQWILVANDDAQNGIAPIQRFAGLAFSRSIQCATGRGKRHLGQIVIDLANARATVSV
jgi:hypothetical protein